MVLIIVTVLTMAIEIYSDAVEKSLLRGSRIYTCSKTSSQKNYSTSRYTDGVTANQIYIHKYSFSILICREGITRGCSPHIDSLTDTSPCNASHPYIYLVPLDQEDSNLMIGYK